MPFGYGKRPDWSPAQFARFGLLKGFLETVYYQYGHNGTWLLQCSGALGTAYPGDFINSCTFAVTGPWSNLGKMQTVSPWVTQYVRNPVQHPTIPANFRGTAGSRYHNPANSGVDGARGVIPWTPNPFPWGNPYPMKWDWPDPVAGTNPLERPKWWQYPEPVQAPPFPGVPRLPVTGPRGAPRPVPVPGPGPFPGQQPAPNPTPRPRPEPGPGPGPVIDPGPTAGPRPSPKPFQLTYGRGRVVIKERWRGRVKVRFKQKEKKFEVPQWVRRAMDAIGEFTEILDFSEILFDNLPKHIRKKVLKIYRKNGKIKFTSNYRDRMKLLWNNLDKVNTSKALDDFFRESALDAAMGGLSKRATKAWRELFPKAVRGPGMVR